jgi:hypothetical protein
MDVKQYYRKIRELEASLTDEYPIIVSIETADGGKGGLLSEVSRSNAARLIIEGRAQLATKDQMEDFYNQQAAARKLAERTEISKRIQVAIVSDPELQASLTTKRRGGSSADGK